MNRFIKGALRFIFFLALLHSLFAIYFWSPSSKTYTLYLAPLCIIPFIYLWRTKKISDSICWIIAIALAALIQLVYLFKSPIKYAWSIGHEKVPFVSIETHTYSISNYRNAEHNETGIVKSNWIERTVSLDQIQGADLILQHFGSTEGIAHAMVSFRMNDGRHLVASVEARRSQTDNYDPLGGMFKYYQTILVLADESDLLWNRIAQEHNRRLLIYPIRCTSDQAQEFFKEIVNLANTWNEKPHFYGTLRSNCFNILFNLTPTLKKRVYPWDRRIIFPGYADDLFGELGLIDDAIKGKGYAENRLVPANVTSPSGMDPKEWSKFIRNSFFTLE